MFFVEKSHQLVGVTNYKQEAGNDSKSDEDGGVGGAGDAGRSPLGVAVPSVLGRGVAVHDG